MHLIYTVYTHIHMLIQYKYTPIHVEATLQRRIVGDGPIHNTYIIIYIMYNIYYNCTVYISTITLAIFTCSCSTPLFNSFTMPSLISICLVWGSSTGAQRPPSICTYNSMRI